MGSGPQLYRPRSELADHIEFFGHWLHRGATYRSRALPRGAVTIVFDVGDRQQLDLYAADGATEMSVPPAFITGSQNTPYVSDIAADEPVVAISISGPGAHFRFWAYPWATWRMDPWASVRSGDGKDATCTSA